MPIDMPLWDLVQENKLRVIGALIRRFDPGYGSENPIYSPDGEWSNDRFADWLLVAGIAEWPRLNSGALELTGDAFRLMYAVHPAIEKYAAAASRRHCARLIPIAAMAATSRACSLPAPLGACRAKPVQRARE
jgi:hypothetical protein